MPWRQVYFSTGAPTTSFLRSSYFRSPPNILGMYIAESTNYYNSSNMDGYILCVRVMKNAKCNTFRSHHAYRTLTTDLQ